MWFRLDNAGLSPLVEREKQGFPAVSNSEDINKQARVQELESEVLPSIQYTESMRRPCQQMASRIYYL